MTFLLAEPLTPFIALGARGLPPPPLPPVCPAGMTGHAPDFGMLMVGGNMGIVGMTKEHLGLALALSVPVFVVITKTDMAPEQVLQVSVNEVLLVRVRAGCYWSV